MRYVNSNGDIAWKATPRLRDYLMDLRLDARLTLRTSNVLDREPATIPFSTEALQANLLRLQNERETVQASRDRDAIYQYLNSIFELVHGGRRRARQSSVLIGRFACEGAEGGQGIRTVCHFDSLHIRSEKADYRTRSKWSRVLRYAVT